MADGEAGPPIRERLLKERNALLDLSTRNRLLNTPLRTRNNRAIEIVDEKASEVFRLLTAGRALVFAPGVELTEEERAGLDPDDDVTGGVPQPEADEADSAGVAARHADLRLQTRLTSEGLQKRLFDIWYDAQTLEQEQGVNILYLAIGLLRWFDSDSADVARHAPLVLLPVRLERSGVADRFKLRWRDEPASPNLTLQAKMRAEFSLTLEDFPDEDEVDLAAYCVKAAEAVAAQKRWEVLPDAMVLGFFSFAKFLMYRDLDPETWPADDGISAHPLITALLRDGFPESAPLVAEGASIDEALPPLEQHHVVDADSSQSVAVAEAAQGRTLVVKGPPGTGKSQTITNIIAAAAARGKKVLFVAEKMAALEVVQRRLRQVGLGPLTLELHSNKVSKRSVLDELRRTRDAQLTPPRGDLSVIQKLADATGGLNAFARRLHAPLQPCGLTPHAILGRLARAQATSAPGGFALTGAESWTADVATQAGEVAVQVAERLRNLGPAQQHPWRGVRCGPLDPAERGAVGARSAAVLDGLATARDAAQTATEILDAPVPATVGDLRLSLTCLQTAPLPAALDRVALASQAWRESDGDLLRAVADRGRAHVAAEAAIEGVFNEAARRGSIDAVRAAVVTKGSSLFRFLDSGYRAQIALLRSYLNGPPPKAKAERLVLIDRLISARAAKAAFDEVAADGKAFGAAWKAERSDWDALRDIANWRARHEMAPAGVWARLATTTGLEQLEAGGQTLAAVLPDLEAELEGLLQALDLDLPRAFGVGVAAEIALDDLAERLADWRDNLEGLGVFIAFAARTRALADLGAASLAEAIHDGKLEASQVRAVLEAAYADVLRRMLFDAWPELKAFDGDAHNDLVATFRRLDVARIGLAQEQIVAAHAAARPQGAAGIGPLGVLNAELAKKRGHLPVRVLLDRAGPAIQQLKPVFMMSPLSVAQFLKPGGLTFDLLVMDEASQIEPVDALGAVARAGQLVVVGDERQLPPTAFFKKLTGEEDQEEADDSVTIQAKDAESILELCLAKGAPHRLLSWHYRSKHQSLIAVSNREFYENKLFIVPSPYDAVADMGLKFNLLADAPYDRGGTRTNPTEARAVAEAVIRHAREHADRSLGVATFSVAQRQIILKELELLRRANPDLENFFGAASSEPFFVKNLENVQGDERDVIFISVGYGKNDQGYLAHAFGPLSGEGGERRLNVLISRAKLRCEVFCNFTGADIDLERARARGVAALKLFLAFAETGHFGLGEPTGGDFESELERQVCERLQALGHDVKRQIGASGFRVDLAITDLERPGRFVLGVECDGAQFHSSRSARDRDRLRQQVLQAHGWIIHRVWSVDWYLRPQEELRKIEAAIAEARSVWRDRDEEGFRPSPAQHLVFEAEDLGDAGEASLAVAVEPAPLRPTQPRTPYVETAFAADTRYEPHEVPVSKMASYVAAVVEREGPIHIDEITSRIRTMWGMGRAGSRVRAAVADAAAEAARRGVIVGGPFYAAPGAPAVVRDRSQVASASLRKPEMLPPAEIEAALLQIVDDNFGARRDELVQATSRAFGFAATSAQLRSVLDANVDRLISAGDLLDRDGVLTRPKAGG